MLGKLNVESASGTRKEYGKNLRYPLDIAESKQDVIKFDVFEYIPQRFDTDGGTAVLQVILLETVKIGKVSDQLYFQYLLELEMIKGLIGVGNL